LVAARGEALDALYFVESGQLEPVGSGQETILGSWRVGPGSCLGDVGLLQGGWVAPMDFVCTESGVVRVFRREALVQLISRQERDALVIYAYLAHHCAARLSSLQGEFSRLRMLLVIS
jgi:CRP-like cAMP-binding protein